ncbi:ABC transporter substrate-binding protein/permease [Aerococcus sp. Group 1]|uniref:ABC transporter substrate-binding protein/permease n=1 Tax=Aerococcus urinae (strain CCUG 59500 / ACS-120-V-Col10a) TaxID=2976812 RepID=UPI000200F3C3|nr:ABC transporter substrate-binding protein/permease [Aerococcus sp. Group 1]AEA00656.1 ABC transporter, permease protein [Aerococcus sp. Group 1]MCY3031565.1 ABC transporter substrate-binding protein/permease [Aerococcus sp. Group 1]MCY3062754.1 ABC transporter substrate-binding protein/permease [Aerococcus sp. Group 1]
MYQCKKMFSALCLFALTLLILLSPSSVYAEENEGKQVAQDDQLLQEIKDRGVLRFGTASGYAPFEFTVLENGQNRLVGTDVFLAQQIADDLGVKLEIVDMEFGSLIPAMETGSVDMIISGMSYTEERDKKVDFSDVYQSDQQYFVIRKQDQDKIKDVSYFDQGGKIGVSDNTLQDTLVTERVTSAEKVAMRKSADAVAALMANQVDAVLLDESVAKAFAAEHGELLAIPSGLDVSSDGKSVAIPNNQPTFLAEINKTVNACVESGQMDQWMEESYDLIRQSQKSNWLSYWPYFYDGIKVTLLISVVAILAGIILGLIIVLMRISNLPVLPQLASAYVEFVRGTPLMVQVLFVFLGVGALFSLSSLLSGIIAVSLNAAAYISEIFRGGILSVDRGQVEAARSLGLNYWTTMKKVVFPQSLRPVWPSLVNEAATLIKDSSIVSTIGVAELTFQTRAVTSLTYQGTIPLFISMCCYFVLTFVTSMALRLYENKMQAKV